MKFSSKIITPFLGCLLVMALFWGGCQNQVPTASSEAPAATDKYALVNITPSGATAALNYLGSHTGFVGEVSYSVPVTVCSGSTPFQLVPSGLQFYNPMGGAVTVYNGPTTDIHGKVTTCFPLSTVGFNVGFVSTGLTDGYDQYGIHITGLINDPENPLYPPGPDNLDNVTVEVLPGSSSGAPYDVSPYQGIQFYINVGISDSAFDRQFLANVEQELPVSGSGSCLGSYDPSLTHCYDGFYYDYGDIPRNQWVLVQKNWADLQQAGFGSKPSPPTFTGTNLQQLVSFQWSELNTGQSGPVTVNYTISGIRFY